MGDPKASVPRPAQECEDLTEIRTAIDGIDRSILIALRNRLDYVRAAGRFKRTSDEVRAAERVKSMLAERRAWAEQLDLDPDWIEEVYRFLIDGFIRLEMKHVEESRR